LEVASKSLKEYKSNEIAFIGSAFATCEDNFVLLKLAKLLNVANVDFARHAIAGDQDDILIREDKTPNTAGAELVIAKTNGAKLEGIYRLIKEGKVKTLFVMEDDLGSISEEWEQALGMLDLLIVTAANSNKTSALADIVFPAATFAEKHGTFVNFQGRVQRIRPAVSLDEMDRALDGMNMSRWDKFGTKFDRWNQGRKHDAKPSWKILALLSSHLGGKIKYEMAEEVFEEISNSIDAFKGLDYDLIGEVGVQLKNFNSELRLAATKSP
ncbi:MAG: molybdopterin-dependent oxidoreductase, partial [Ignavibacteria bacterium]|nr:molybdopterin-dependent oxidoreductase [Ignavibacteria bacterium]